MKRGLSGIESDEEKHPESGSVTEVGDDQRGADKGKSPERQKKHRAQDGNGKIAFEDERFEARP